MGSEKVSRFSVLSKFVVLVGRELSSLLDFNFLLLREFFLSEPHIYNCDSTAFVLSVLTILVVWLDLLLSAFHIRKKHMCFIT